MRKRAKIEIISDIMFFIRNQEKGAKITHILYKANLSVPLLRKYLNSLVRDGLVNKTITGKRPTYVLTEKGQKFLNILRKLNSMTEIIEIYNAKRKAARH